VLSAPMCRRIRAPSSGPEAEPRKCALAVSVRESIDDGYGDCGDIAVWPRSGERPVSPAFPGAIRIAFRRSATLQESFRCDVRARSKASRAALRRRRCALLRYEAFSPSGANSAKELAVSAENGRRAEPRRFEGFAYSLAGKRAVSAARKRRLARSHVAGQSGRLYQSRKLLELASFGRVVGAWFVGRI